MRLLRVELSNNVIFGNASFYFVDAKNINTISGMNGAGKTSLFSVINTVQKAYFANLISSDVPVNYDIEEAKQSVENDCHRYINSGSGSVLLELLFDHSDFDLIKDKKVLDNIGVDISKDTTVSINLTVSQNYLNVVPYTDWRVEIEDPAEAEILRLFWNLNNPLDLILYMTAERKVQEPDATFESIQLHQDRGIAKVIDVILGSENIYDNLYTIMMDDYILERIDPRNSSNKRDKYVSISKAEFSKLLPYIKVVNFSSKKKPDQFILIAKKTNNNAIIDIRDFSSGEKLIWYSLLLLYYVKNIGVLIIDEPENHLHEELAWKFVTYLSDICEGKKNDVGLSQVYLLTHSKSLIYNNFTTGCNYVLENNHLLKLDYGNAEEELRHIGISYVDERILFVEGKSDVTVLSSLLIPYNITIKELESSANVIKAYEGIQRISDYVQDKRIAFLIDRDTRDDEDIQRIKQENADYYDKHFVVMDRHEIENYLLDPSVIHECLHEKFYNITSKADEWTEEKVSNLEKTFADGMLPETKKKYLNEYLHGKLESIDSLVKQGEIKAESQQEYEAYIDSIIKSTDWQNVRESMKAGFQKMEVKYGDNNWNINWLSLCDGKRVFNQTTAKIAGDIRIRPGLLKENILQFFCQKQNSDLAKLVSKIAALLCGDGANYE